MIKRITEQQIEDATLDILENDLGYEYINQEMASEVLQ